MNPQPSEMFGHLLAVAFVASIIYHFIQAYNDPSRHINAKDMDLVTFGYVENSPVYLIDRSKKDFTSSQLFKDCVGALNALGMKKTEAKNKAIQVFTNSDPQPQSVQEFLMVALKK
jgi:hypothetical protein